jgi:hypothetical protein
MVYELHLKLRIDTGQPGYVPGTPPFNLERQERLGRRRAVLSAAQSRWLKSLVDIS